MMSLQPLDLHLFDELPRGFQETPVNCLANILPGPSLIRIPGEREPPLFVSILLHGNEITGLLAIQQLLIYYQQKGLSLPRTLLLFVGNVEAAQYGVRHLAGQRDFNRLWAGGNGPEFEMAQALLAILAQTPLFAGIDIHNNTGKNPMYACVNRTEDAYIKLARAFSPTIVYFTEPHQVMSMALSAFCPAVTLECGMPGEPEGTVYVAEFLQRILETPECLDAANLDKDFDLFHTVAKILVPNEVRIGFGYENPEYHFCFKEDFENLNFRLLPHDSVLGWRFNTDSRLVAIDNNGKDISSQFFHYDKQQILTRKSFLPSMFTKDIRVIYQDCLGYIMEHYPIYT